MRSHSLQPSSRQFVGPLRSSFFERDARWNLKLSSRFPNCENAPTSDQRLWQSIRSYLLIANRHTRSILPILPDPIFKNMAKQAYQHTHSTILTHNARAQMPTLGKASRDASDTRAWHTHSHTLTLRTFFSWNRLTMASDHCVR